MQMLFWLLLALSPLGHALHFYLQTDETKCFFEDLPADTIAVGKFAVTEYNTQFNNYMENKANLKLEITVDETFDNNHRVVSQKNSPVGQFTFTSLDSGEHKFCITPRHTNWASKAKHRVYFDLVVGEANQFVDSKRDKEVNYLTMKTNELIKKLTDLKREQSLLRLKESTFRDISEHTNSRSVKWIIIQLIVLVATGCYQMFYLKNFFVKQKVV